MDGAWTDPSKWSTDPFFPNNGNPQAATYDVTVAATVAGTYTLTLNTAGAGITVNTLDLRSPNVRFVHAGGTLALAGTGSGSGSPLRIANSAEYWVAGGTLHLSSPLGVSHIGVDGAGIMRHKAGTVIQYGPVIIGVGGGSLANGNGTLRIASQGRWVLDPTDTIEKYTAVGVGPAGVGTLLVESSETAAFSNLSIGVSGGHGSLLLGQQTGTSIGALTAHRLTVGSGPWGIGGLGTSGFGTAILNQSASRIDVVAAHPSNLGALSIGGGDDGTGEGRFFVSAGTLTTQFARITDTGLLDVSGGRVLFDLMPTMSGIIKLRGTGRIGSGDSYISLTRGGQLDVSGGTFSVGQLHVADGTQTILAAAGNVSIGSFTQLSGSSTFSGSSVLTSNQLAIGGNARLRLDGGTVNAGSILMSGGTFDFSGGTLNISSLRITGGRFTLVPGADVRLDVSFLEVEQAGTLDIGDNRVTIDYVGPSPIAQIRDSVARAYADRTWTGTGITSSLASNTLGVGYADFANASIILRLARFGDADLDGVVNLADFNRLAANFGASNAVWSMGDFNYDGLVNLADFNRLAANFGLSAAGPEVTPEDWSALAGAVPEPGCASAAVIFGLAALRRRRR